MTDAWIVAILIVVIFVGLRSTAKHMKGQGGCCGGGSEVKTKPRKLKHIKEQRTLLIEGMTCGHCKDREESRLNELPGISAKVSLKEKKAVVSMERELSDEKLKETVEKAGYQVVEIIHSPES